MSPAIPCCGASGLNVSQTRRGSERSPYILERFSAGVTLALALCLVACSGGADGVAATSERSPNSLQGSRD
jgi:hypothetical protein